MMGAPADDTSLNLNSSATFADMWSWIFFILTSLTQAQDLLKKSGSESQTDKYEPEKRLFWGNCCLSLRENIIKPNKRQ